MSAPRVGALRDGVLLALGTLLAMRVPAPRRIDRRVARTAMLLAPVAGLVPGAAAATVLALARAVGLDALPAAALAVAALALSTRGLHLDGLADTADGLGSGYDRGRALEVMRRGDTGPAGAATLVLVLVVQVGALAQSSAATGARGPLAVLVAAVAARSVIPVVCVRGVPPARESGLGATVAGTVPRAGAAAVVIAAALAAATVTAAQGGVPWAGAAAVAAAVVTGGLLLHRCVRRFGGLSGDVVGACVETATAAALLALAAAGRT